MQDYAIGMSDEPAEIHRSKQPRRPHYLKEWMERRNLRPVDLVNDLGVDKSNVSKWLTGASPGTVWQDRLRDYFGAGDEGIFRHPDDDWMARFLTGRPPDEIERIKTTLEAAFPRKTG